MAKLITPNRDIASMLDYIRRYCTLQHLRSMQMGSDMAPTKTATVTFRIDPKVKEALQQAAEKEHRSLANMIEVMIRAYCSGESIKGVGASDLSEEAPDA